MADDNNTKRRRVEKGRGREGAMGVQGALFFYYSLSISDPPTAAAGCAAPHLPLLDHINPTKTTNAMRRDSPFVAFPFVLNATGRGKPLLVAFPFVLNATGRGKPPPRRVSFRFERDEEGFSLVAFPFV